jgi:hypothetical protein
MLSFRRATHIFAFVLLAVLLVLPQPSNATLARSNTSAPQVAVACDDPWQIVASRVVGFGGTALNDIVALAPNNLWAVGYQTTTDSRYRQPLIQHWDGKDWAPVAAPSVDPGGVLYGVAAAGPNDIWAVGTIQNVSTWQTLILHWNGSGWSRVPSPNTIRTFNALYDVAVVTSNNVWAVGDDGGQPVIMRWNGAQWSLVAYPNLGDTNPWLRGIAAITAMISGRLATTP